MLGYDEMLHILLCKHIPPLFDLCSQSKVSHHCPQLSILLMLDQTVLQGGRGEFRVVIQDSMIMGVEGVASARDT